MGSSPGSLREPHGSYDRKSTTLITGSLPLNINEERYKDMKTVVGMRRQKKDNERKTEGMNKK